MSSTDNVYNPLTGDILPRPTSTSACLDVVPASSSIGTIGAPEGYDDSGIARYSLLNLQDDIDIFLWGTSSGSTINYDVLKYSSTGGIYVAKRHDRSLSVGDAGNIGGIKLSSTTFFITCNNGAGAEIFHATYNTSNDLITINDSLYLSTHYYGYCTQAGDETGLYVVSLSSSGLVQVSRVDYSDGVLTETSFGTKDYGFDEFDLIFQAGCIDVNTGFALFDDDSDGHKYKAFAFKYIPGSGVSFKADFIHLLTDSDTTSGFTDGRTAIIKLQDSGDYALHAMYVCDYNNDLWFAILSSTKNKDFDVLNIEAVSVDKDLTSNLSAPYEVSVPVSDTGRPLIATVDEQTFFLIVRDKDNEILYLHQVQWNQSETDITSPYTVQDNDNLTYFGETYVADISGATPAAITRFNNSSFIGFYLNESVSPTEIQFFSVPT